jgi:hypothetical protein
VRCTPASLWRRVLLPERPDPDKALRHQMLQLDLQKKMKDATKEQVGDKEVEALAKMYAANKLVPPSRPNEVAQKAIARAMEIDPNYDPELAANRAKAIKDFSGNGQASQVVRSVNRLASHLHDMFDASEKMGGPNLGMSAPSTSSLRGVEQQGMPETVAAYDAAKPFVATELEKIMKGAGQPTVSGIEEAMKGLDRARSLDERRAAFKQIAALVHGALDPIKQSWNSAYGGTKAPPMWVSPEAAKYSAISTRTMLEPSAATIGAGFPVSRVTARRGRERRPTIVAISQKIRLALPLALREPKSRAGRWIRRSRRCWPAEPRPVRSANSPRTTATPRISTAFSPSAPCTRPTRAAMTFTRKDRPDHALQSLGRKPGCCWLAGAADAATMGLGDEAIGAVNTLKDGGSLADNIASADYGKQMLASENPGASLAGSVVGGAGAMIGGGLGLKALLAGGAKGGVGRNLLAWAARNPIKTAAAGDMAYGTGYGAGENNDNRALGAGVGGRQPAREFCWFGCRQGRRAGHWWRRRSRCSAASRAGYSPDRWRSARRRLQEGPGCADQRVRSRQHGRTPLCRWAQGDE